MDREDRQDYNPIPKNSVSSEGLLLLLLLSFTAAVSGCYTHLKRRCVKTQKNFVTGGQRSTDRRRVLLVCVVLISGSIHGERTLSYYCV